MIVYRFAHRKYASDISGEGARLRGGRWNHKGIPALYASEFISLGLLEVLVNANTLEELQQIRLIEIDIPDNASTTVFTPKKLKKGWNTDVEYTQWLGTEIIRHNTVLVIKCPSAVIDKEHNFIINPLHKDFKKVKVVDASSFYFDERLFKTTT